MIIIGISICGKIHNLTSSSNVLHYTALCRIDVVHYYCYSSALFDEKYTSVQFVETILWLNLTKLYVSGALNEELLETSYNDLEIYQD